jgi:hypothetical protein
VPRGYSTTYLSQLVRTRVGPRATLPGRRTVAQVLWLCARKNRTISADASGRIGSVKDPIRAPSVPRVPAATHRPGLSEDDAVEVGVHGERAVLQADITLDGVRVPAGNVLPGARSFKDAARAPPGRNRRTGKLRSSRISHAHASGTRCTAVVGHITDLETIVCRRVHGPTRV